MQLHAAGIVNDPRSGLRLKIKSLRNRPYRSHNVYALHRILPISGSQRRVTERFQRWRRSTFRVQYRNDLTFQSP